MTSNDNDERLMKLNARIDELRTITNDFYIARVAWEERARKAEATVATLTTIIIEAYRQTVNLRDAEARMVPRADPHARAVGSDGLPLPCPKCGIRHTEGSLCPIKS